MKYYLDITLLPDAEANLGFIWYKVYQQIHVSLAELGFLSGELVKARNGKQEPLKKSHIALSFPKYSSQKNRSHKYPLGNVLRLFAETKEQLESLNVPELLNRLTDYTHFKTIQPVDETKVEKHVCFKRKQFKSPSRIIKDIERRSKYLANMNSENIGDVKSRLVEESKKYNARSTLPFINLMSLSSKPDVPLPEKDRFLLFIEMQDMDTEIKGNFSCYGLSTREPSKQATVPWFK